MNMYPNTITQAYNLAIKYKGAHTKSGCGGRNGDRFKNINKEGVSLATDVREKRDISKIQCFCCQKMGHYAQDCKEKKDEAPVELVNTTTTAPASNVSEMTGVTGGAVKQSAPAGSTVDPGTIKHVQLSTFVLEGEDFNFLQNTCKGMIPDTWVLLGSQSTCSVVKNGRLLMNICDCAPAAMHSQGGQNTLTQKGLLGSVEVCFYEVGLANIISLVKLRQKYRITFNSSNGNAFIVHNVNGKQMIFKQSPEGLWVTVGLPYHVNRFSSCTGHTKELKTPSNSARSAEFKTGLCQIIFLTQRC